MLYEVRTQEIKIPDGVPIEKSPIMFRECIVGNFLEPPYIVSGSRNRFVKVCKRGGVVRSVIRNDFNLIGDVYVGVISVVKEMGLEFGWGNEFKFDTDGVKAAKKYVLEYGEWDGGITIYSGFKFEDEIGVNVVDFLPSDLAVVATTKPEYFGDIHIYGNKHYSVFVHNPGRSISLIRRGS